MRMSPSPKSTSSKPGLSRRRFLAALCLMPLVGAVRANAAPRIDWRVQLLQRDRVLALVRPDSNQKASFCYYRHGKGWQREGYQAACVLLRDVEYKKTVRMDPKLIDCLYLIQGWLRAKGKPYVIHILSGYRTSAHNRKLEREGAAKNSLHMRAMAADIRIPGVSARDIAQLAKAIGVGGVGIYPSKGFIHVDTGDKRSWVAQEFGDSSDVEWFASASLDWESNLWTEFDQLVA